MSARAPRRRGMSVRGKLLLLSAGPVLVTGTLLAALFTWSHEVGYRAYEDALAWQHHAQALRSLDGAARFYVDTIADGIVQDPMPHGTESRQALTRARAEALSLSRRFSADEQASQERLEAALRELVDEGERVGKDRGRLSALEMKYRGVIREQINRRIEEEDAGSAHAIRKANELAHALHAAGLTFTLLTLLTAIGAAAFAIRGFGGRVASLEEAAARVAAGDLEDAVPVTSGDELGRLAASLNTMVEALRRQRIRQLGFLAAVAHDLRNPLSAMRFTTEPLLRTTALPAEPVLRKSLALVDRQIERLRRMADDLLDAASIEAGELKLEPRACDLAAVTRNVAELYVGTSPRHELRLSLPAEPLMVVCDPTRIAQVLDNLVGNAIKYSPAGGSVEVKLSTVGEEVVVSVADTGPGIEPGMSEAIFEPFGRLSPSKDVVPGVGLGLWICRRIVLAHGGGIEVESKLGQGTRFQVRLPRQTIRPAPTDAEKRHGRVDDSRAPEQQP
jgi:signal transduction histidine kinase